MFGASKTASVATVVSQTVRSLRFNSADTATLARTPAIAGNRKTWTWSAWVKRVTFGTTQIFFVAGVDGSNYTNLYFSGSVTDNLEIYNYTSGVNAGYHYTTSVFRDPSAWYHIVYSVDTTQAAFADRVKIYVNSVLQPVTIGTTFSSSVDTWIDSANQHYIGRNGPTNASQYFDGYMTDVNFIDGQALTPSSFGETNVQTGVWQPKAFVGTYGTNGFYLNFSDNSNTTAATLGKDYSGNGNNWTPNNFSVSAGAGNDSLVDSPITSGVDTGLGGQVSSNYCTINPLSNLNWYSQNGTLTPYNGNLQFNVDANGEMMDCTIAVSSGKWYWELTQSSFIRNGIRSIRGIPTGDLTYVYYQADGQVLYVPYNSTSSTILTTVATSTSGDIIGIALDLDNFTISWYKNNTLLYTATGIVADTYTPCVAGAASSTGATINFGQRPFAYTAPSGFKALCTQNLPTPTIGAATASLANSFFTTTTLTGTGSARVITNGMQSDFIWTKSIDTGNQFLLHDVVRGPSRYVNSASTLAEAYDANYYVTSFNSNGFNIGLSDNALNASGINYVAWAWKANGTGVTNTAGSITSTVSANTTSGFSVITYTNASSGISTVGHGLGVAPSMIIFKTRSTAFQWNVYHASLGNDAYIVLNTTGAQVTGATSLWNSTSPTSTVFTLGTAWTGALPSVTMVAYCFAPVAGYSAFGSYIGNGSANGPFIYTGFRPAFVMVKSTSGGENWIMLDATRNTYNVTNNKLSANTQAPQNDASIGDATQNNFDFLSNGFKAVTTNSGTNGSGSVIIYMAFASNPFKYSLAR
jgi:hypothetical protein